MRDAATGNVPCNGWLTWMGIYINQSVYCIVEYAFCLYVHHNICLAGHCSKGVVCVGYGWEYLLTPMINCSIVVFMFLYYSNVVHYCTLYVFGIALCLWSLLWNAEMETCRSELCWFQIENSQNWEDRVNFFTAGFIFIKVVGSSILLFLTRTLFYVIWVWCKSNL